MLLLITLSAISLRGLTAREVLGSACSISNNHLDANTKEFITDCDSFGYCSIEGICKPRGCRRDEFVLTSLLESNQTVPPLCPSDAFCPDDASVCLPLVGLGGRCQLNRDDECAPPPGVVPPDMNDPWRDTYTGATCLSGVCVWANVTVGGACISESTPYIGYDVSGMSFTNTVIRDNCVADTGYCDLGSNTCAELKTLDTQCEADRECRSFNCNPSGHCAVPPETAVRVPKWVYALVSLGLALCMAIVVFLLVVMHRRSQAAKRIMLEEYYREQTGYRNSIISFHTALANHSSDKLLDTSKEYEDSQRSPDDGHARRMSRSMSNLSDTTVVDRR